MWRGGRWLIQAGTVALGVAAAVACGGCATLAHGTHQAVLIQSEPSGAAVLIDDRAVGHTPVTVRLSRRHRPQLTVMKDGYERTDVRIPRHASRWLIGDAAIVLNPLQVQGWDSVHDWPQHISASFATTAGVDLLTGGAFVFPPVVRVQLAPIP